MLQLTVLGKPLDKTDNPQHSGKAIQAKHISQALINIDKAGNKQDITCVLVCIEWSNNTVDLIDC